MKSLAVFLVIWALASIWLMSFLLNLDQDRRWSLERSPITGVCYEVYTYAPIVFWMLGSAHPVDSHYCDKAEKEGD